MRLLFLILLLANVAAFGYIRFAESRAGADAQNAPLQISPEKMKLLKPGRGAQITVSGASDVKSVTATSTAFIGAWKCDYYSGYEIAYFPDSTFVLHVIQPHQNFFLFGHFTLQGARKSALSNGNRNQIVGPRHCSAWVDNC